VIPYIVAQLAGSLLGVLTARAVWGSVIDGPPVNSACLQPASGWTNWTLFPAEAASMAAIVLLVAWFLAVPRLAPLVPGLAGFLVGLAIAVLGPITGGSLNPASSVRQFSQAILISYGSTCLLRWSEPRWRPWCSSS
jgi:glycerol uptake facilitator protein/aquaporin Z